MALTTTAWQLPGNSQGFLDGRKYTTDMYFNPIEDADGNWIISNEEYNQMDTEIKNEFPWLNALVQIPYNPITPIDPMGIPIGPPAIE